MYRGHRWVVEPQYRYLSVQLNQPSTARKHMKNDVAAYMRYYNIDRLHSANDDLSPMKFELSELNVSTTA